MKNPTRRAGSYGTYWLLILGILCTAIGCAPGTASSTLVVLVRHAEKERDAGSDPQLTEAGRERARALAGALSHAGIERIITTQYRRTIATAAPLAEINGVRSEEIPATGELGKHIRAVVDAVRSRPGEAVLIVGHSNTVPRIVHALGGPELGDLDEGDYSTVFAMELDPKGATRLLRLAYGESSP